MAHFHPECYAHFIRYLQLNSEIAQIKVRLAKNQNSEDVIRYKFLGDKWSEEYVKTTIPNILTKDGLLFYTNILEFHKTIFPPDFPWSGKIRTQDVVIQGSFGTVLPSRSEGTVEYSLEPIPKDDVLISMERLCNSWNTNINRLRMETAEIKLESIARYHHEFQMIHPFIDGNGRVGRVILSDMSEYLLNRPIDPDFNREEYYSALHLADMGKFEPLSEVIYKQLKI